MSYINSMTVGTYRVKAVSALMHNNVLLQVSYFDRSRNICKAVAATIDSGYPVRFGRKDGKTSKQDYLRLMELVPMGRDRFTLVTMVNKEIGKTYILTDDENLDEDFFNFLMNNYKLPLLKEWTPAIREELLGKRLVNEDRSWNSRFKAESGDPELSVPGVYIHDREVDVNDVRIFAVAGLDDKSLSEVVTDLIERHVISVCDVDSEPLEFENMDQYITKYGPSLVKNLEEQMETLSPLNGELKGFAAKNKRLYPQQAACVNGMIALKNSGSQYGLMVEGMGCGKTLQGAAVVDACFNQEWLLKHPGKTLKDMYLSKEDRPVYRNVLMAPSHLVEKWKEEITSEIPMSRVEIIKDLDQLLKLRSEGKKRKGKEWYLISKDFAKLGSQQSPIPSSVTHMKAKGLICKDCAQEGEVSWISARGKKCDRCGGKDYIKKELTAYGDLYGLVCPQCGELLLQGGKKYYDADDAATVVLQPKDFSSHRNSNDSCLLCGTHLWGVDARPMVGKGLKDLAPEKKWYKVSHWKNAQKKNRASAFVLKGHEDEYYKDAEVDINGVKKSKIEYGPRRFSPSLFIKKYLKGYFDFCILDEAHKYENGGTAQSIAAHALMKASSFTLCLTGTISNGKADSFFYLLYMLDPRRMRKMGYEYSDVMAFSRTYGAVETAYEALGSDDGERHSQSRGRQIRAPKVKPGISPRLFTDFLLDKAVFLDLSDLSKFMPPLKEKVVTMRLPEEVMDSYSRSLDILKEASRQKGGRGLLSTMLQLGLAYPDKPYGFLPIVNPRVEDDVVLVPPSHDEYAGDVLLPKEEELVNIVRSEIAEDRNVFVYCAYTGSAEMNITTRLQKVIEENCNLAGSVLVMNAASPKATEREAYIRKKATEGIRVFICNMKLVETGLDFCFKVDGKSYNYPTIVFYQMTYELAVMWQASRRHFRLNQTEECRTYYMAYENTLQAAAVQIMAEKQVAASAIQGKFSADGLAAMANGVDPRVKLAQMLAENDTSDRESLESMFDVMNASNNDNSDDRYDSYQPPQTFYELMEGAVVEDDVVPKEKPALGGIFDEIMKISANVSKSSDDETSVEITEEVVTVTKAEEKKEEKSAPSKPAFTFQQGFMFNLATDAAGVSATVETSAEPDPVPAPKTKAKKKSCFAGQTSIFGFAA